MIVLGVDPGTASMGYGVIESRQGTLTLRAFGCIHTSKEHSPSHRLQEIHVQMGQVVDDYQPDVMSVESLFFSTNAKTAIAVGQARGVALLVAAQQRIAVAEYTPLQVKSALTGQGKAEKRQVQYMVQRLLSMKERPEPDDAADALAIAICHANSAQLRAISGQRGKELEVMNGSRKSNRDRLIAESLRRSSLVTRRSV